MEAVEDSWSYSEILIESVYMLAQSYPTFSHQENPLIVSTCSASN